MKHFILVLMFFFSVLAGHAQDEEKEKGFKKENLFTGGSVSLSFGNSTFLIGGNPVLGYSITKWLDGGIVINYIYSSSRDYYAYLDKLRQSIYGGGVFTRIFPVRFLFVQAQAEHNWIRQKYIPPAGASSTTMTVSANSILVGAGYTTGREPGSGSPYYYLSVLFDVAKQTYSPYTDAASRSIPIIRAGLNIPLFQGSRERD